MRIIYKIKEFPDPGDRDFYYGIQEINKNNYQKALKIFQKSSSYQNEYALLFMAIFYFTGFGLDKRDSEKAFELLQKVALNWNNPVAQYLLGEMFCRGDDGIPPNHTSGIHWMTLAANNGWSNANLLLGRAYWCGEFVQEDHKKAVIYFKRVAKIKKEESTSIDDPVLYLFGSKDFEMDFTDVNPEIVAAAKAKLVYETFSPLKCMRTPYKSNDSNRQEKKYVHFWSNLTNMKANNKIIAQLCLAQIYASGNNNVPKEGKKAMRFAKKATNSRNASAFTLVAQFYEGGIGVDQNYEKAMKWHKQSQILKEDTLSLFYIGKLYFFGQGVRKDHKSALGYFMLMLSHDNEHGESIYYLGEIFEKGEDGIPRNYGKAFKCYRQAFELDYSKGATSIGYLYHKGLGVEKDMAKAYEWFNKASSMNCAAADYMLGIYYLHGYHVIKDLFRALELFNRSYEGGNKAAEAKIIQLLSTICS